jgi:hypothetical protein
MHTVNPGPDDAPVLSIGEQLGDDRPGRVYDFSNPAGDMDGWRIRAAALRELEQRSAGLAAQAEQLLAQADATSALRGIGLAVLALRAELESQEARRDR